MGEFRDKGYDAGLQVANDCRNEIEQCNTKTALANLCGKKIEILVRHPDYWIAKYPSFKEGFFESFMNFGEDYLENLNMRKNQKNV